MAAADRRWPLKTGSRTGRSGSTARGRQGRPVMTDTGILRCGIVAVVGAPNAGKSTLVNRLVGAKVSIVTHKVQTTRTRIRGIAMQGDAQIRSEEHTSELQSLMRISSAVFCL